MPEMHLVVFFINKSALMVVLPKKYRNYATVSRYSSFYDR